MKRVAEGVTTTVQEGVAVSTGSWCLLFGRRMS